MNKIIKAVLIPIIAVGVIFGLATIFKKPIALKAGATVCFPYTGCTGTNTVPSKGQILMGTSDGKYEVVSTSSLGITSGSIQVATTTFNSVLTPQILLGTVSNFLGLTKPSAKNELYLVPTTSISAILNLDGLTTSDKTFYFPDNSGIFALTSDIGATTTFNSVNNSGNGTTSGNQVISGNLNVGGNLYGNGSNLTGITGGYFIPGTNGLYYSSSTKPNVGIGTSTPDSLLTVYASSTNMFAIKVATTNSAIDANIQLWGGGLSPSLHWVIRDDDSDSDSFKIGTSTESLGLLKIASDGSPMFRLPPNTSTTFDIKQGDTSYLTVDTSTDDQKIVFGKNAEIGTINVDRDSGGVNFVDMSITATSTAGTANNLSIALDGNAILTVYASSTGNGMIEQLRVGISTTTPLAKLEIRGTASTTGDLFRVSTSTIYGMVIDGMGKVGVGTFTPSKLLHVLGGTVGGDVLFERTTSGTIGTYAAQDIRTRSTGNMADTFGTQLSFSIGDDTSASNQIAVINAFRDGADNSGALGFYTATSGSSVARMIIKSNGFVGFGTSSPTASVVIYDAMATSTLFISSGILPGEIILKDTIGNNCTRIVTYAGAIKSEVANCPKQ